MVHALVFERVDEFFVALTKEVVLAAADPQQLELGVGGSWIGENRLGDVSVDGGAALNAPTQAKRSRFPRPTLSDCPPPMLRPAMARWPALGATR